MDVWAGAPFTRMPKDHYVKANVPKCLGPLYISTLEPHHNTFTDLVGWRIPRPLYSKFWLDEVRLLIPNLPEVTSRVRIDDQYRGKLGKDANVYSGIFQNDELAMALVITTVLGEKAVRSNTQELRLSTGLSTTVTSRHSRFTTPEVSVSWRLDTDTRVDAQSFYFKSSLSQMMTYESSEHGYFCFQISVECIASSQVRSDFKPTKTCFSMLKGIELNSAFVYKTTQRHLARVRVLIITQSHTDLGCIGLQLMKLLPAGDKKGMILKFSLKTPRERAVNSSGLDFIISRVPLTSEIPLSSSIGKTSKRSLDPRSLGIPHPVCLSRAQQSMCLVFPGLSSKLSAGHDFKTQPDGRLIP